MIDPTVIKREFRLDPQVRYLNHAAVAPWPERTRKAVEAFARENASRGSQAYPQWLETEAALRESCRRLINAPAAEDIALLKNTSEALSVVAHGLPWRPGDNLVISDQEFPSNRIVWESLAGRGVEVRRVDLRSGASPESALQDAMDVHTRLCSISAVQYATGLRIDLPALGRVCRARGVLFCVDAIQQVGALGFDAQACCADFVMADGHKWMLGPEGLALFYCRAPLRPQLDLHQYGWHMVEHAHDFDRPDWSPAQSARRFECGSPNMLGVHALQASLCVLLELGMEAIEQAVLSNAARVMELVDAAPELELLSDTRPGRYAGIVTFRHRRVPAETLYKRLMAQGVMCAQRGGGVRFSPHFYTADAIIASAVRLAAHGGQG